MPGGFTFGMDVCDPVNHGLDLATTTPFNPTVPA
jgi:hypothetical protein